jgi:transcriptional regulator GlxA family with amidase domain
MKIRAEKSAKDRFPEDIAVPATAERVQPKNRKTRDSRPVCASKFDVIEAGVPEFWASRAAVPKRNRDLVGEIVAHLEANFTEPVTLHDLEELTDLNAFQLIRLFRRLVGTTPHAFLMQLRVRRARALLSSGESIIGAAAETGFVDQSHLTKHFKRAFGTTPGDFVRNSTAH